MKNMYIGLCLGMIEHSESAEFDRILEMCYDIAGQYDGAMG